MASTYSPYLRLELIGTGEQTGTWGATTNTNLGTLIDQAVAGTATVDVTAGNVTLTALNGASDQSRQAILKITGTPGAARNVIAPESSKWYLISNDCGQTITLKGASTTGYAIADGETLLMFWNGTDFVPGSSTALGYTPVNKAGDTMTGALYLPAATPTLSTQAANKAYVDAAVSGAVGGNFVLKAGDTMTGPLVLPGAPTLTNQASTKGYVDNSIANAGFATQTWVTQQNYVTTTTSSLTNYYTKTDSDNRYVSTSTQNLQYYPLTTTVANTYATISSLTNYVTNTYLTTNYSTTTAINTALGFYCAKQDNLSGLNNVSTARTNLGLGTMATANTTDYVPKTGGAFTGNVTNSGYFLGNNIYGGTGISSSIVLGIGGTGSAVNFYAPLTGNSYNSIFYSATGTATGSQTFAVSFNNGSGTNYSPYTFNGAGNATATVGSWIDGSDKRIKENITPLSSGLDVIDALNPVKYSFIIDGLSEPNRYGLIAQEVEQVIPDVVFTSPNETFGIEDFKAVAYTNLIPVLIKAIQELKDEVDALKAAK